jgi:hypothetical protein
MADVTQAKGSNITHMRDWVQRFRGAEAWQRILEALPDAERAATQSVVAVGWYPFTLQLKLLTAVDQVLGTSEVPVITQIARWEADQDLTKVHRLFLRLANPAYVLEKSGEYWRRFYDQGTWEVERLSDRSARGTLRDLPEVEPQFCSYLGAYIHRMWELVGAKDVSITHSQCVTRGDPACTYAGSWK